MALYDVTYEDEEKLASDLERSLTTHFRVSRINSKTYYKMCQTIDEELNELRPTKKSSLIWTKAGALIGRNSMCPHRNLTHLWDNAITIYGNGDTLLKFIGTLVMWRISLREDTWLVYRQETGKTDPETGKEIKVCEYWIDKNYVYPNRQHTVEDLIAKFRKKK